MKILFKNIRMMAIAIMAITLLGCADDDDDDNLPEVIAGFTQTIDNETGTVTFLNTSENATSFSWDFGDGTSSNEINPVKAYENGEFTVVLTASNVAGGEDTFEDTFTVFVRGPITLPVTFDNDSVNYAATTFNGASYDVRINPAPGGSNNKSGNVGAITNSGAEFEGVFFDLGTPVDMEDNMTIRMNLWSESELDVLLKLEEGSAASIETAVSHGGTGWESLDFNFTSTDEYSRLTLFIDGPGTTVGIFFVDDIEQVRTAMAPLITLIGDATININTGDPFEDPGATAIDDVDGDISANIVVGGDMVDVNTPGTYVITYNVSDSEGNAANEVTRTVIVSDAGAGGCTADLIAATSLPLDFEGCETFLSDQNFGSGITSMIAANPSQGGINTSNFALQVDKVSGADFFAGIQNVFENNFDLTTTNVFKMKVYSTKANVVFRFELAANPNDGSIGNPPPVFQTITNANEWTELEFSFTPLPGGPTAYRQFVIKPDNDEVDSPITADGTYYIDDITLEAPGGGGNEFDDGLLTNGDFENGADSWTAGVGSDPAPTATEDGNTFYSANVAMAGDAFAVNLTQKLEIVQGETYILTFDAWSDRDRAIIAGIGLSGGDFSNNSVPVDITATRDTYTLTLTATGFGASDARVLFDNGAAAGLVNIDNVSLVLDNGGGGDTTPPVITLNGDATINLIEGDAFTDPGATASDDTDGDISGSITVGGDAVDNSTVGMYVITYNVMDAAGNSAAQVTRTVNVNAFDDGLLTNGSFQAGASQWTAGVGSDAAPVATEGGNTFYSADVAMAGDAFAVNLTQKLEIIQDETYVLTFDAWSDRDRAIIAGIGLSGGDFSNNSMPVNITAVRQTYTLTLTASGFGASDARVLFDNGAEAGLVNIDNVSLVVDGGGSGGSSGGCTDTPIAATALPLDFEGCETFPSDLNFGAMLTSMLAENPSKTGINTSDFVLQIDKPTGSEFFAGVQNIFTNTFDLTTTNTFKIKVFSTKANVVFRFEIAANPNDGSIGNPPPVFRTVTNANEWTELEFSFSPLPGGPTAYRQFVIKPDNDEMDSAITAGGTYYVDDLRLE